MRFCICDVYVYDCARLQLHTLGHTSVQLTQNVDAELVSGIIIVVVPNDFHLNRIIPISIGHFRPCRFRTQFEPFRQE